MLEEQLKCTVEEVEKESALKEVSKANPQDKGAALESAERRIAEAEKAHEVTEKRQWTRKVNWERLRLGLKRWPI